MKEIITSVSNPKIKYFKSLKDKSTRTKEKVFLVEGANIIKDLKDNVYVLSLIVAEDKAEQFCNIIKRFEEKNAHIYIVSQKCMQQISDTLTPCGLIAVVGIPQCEFDSDTDVAVLDNLSDPGNFGTIIRTCVACGIKQILAVNATDWTSGKVVRSSMGGVFNVNIITTDSSEKAIQMLKNHKVFTLDMGGENLFDTHIQEKNPFAVVVGNEAHGVSKAFRERADKVLSLPMKGPIESLNAGVAMSVALYNLVFQNK